MRISALATKEVEPKKIKGPLFYFLFDLFLEARAEILTKISLVFWSIWRHQNNISKLTDL